jgi:hypothetical protein
MVKIVTNPQHSLHGSIYFSGKRGGAFPVEPCRDGISCNGASPNPKGGNHMNRQYPFSRNAVSRHNGRNPNQSEQKACNQNQCEQNGCNRNNCHQNSGHQSHCDSCNGSIRKPCCDDCPSKNPCVVCPPGPQGPAGETGPIGPKVPPAPKALWATQARKVPKGFPAAY